MRRTAFGNGARFRIVFAGLFLFGIDTGIGSERLFLFEAGDVAYFSNELRAENVSHAVHRHDNIVLGQNFGNGMHLSN